MIVTSHTKGWKIINQRSHGLLAAMLAYQYDIDLPNEIMVPALIAIAEHDDGVQETAQSNNLTDAGAPRHFQVDAGTSRSNLKQQQSVMEIACSKSQMNALLTSLHMKFLYEDNEDVKDKKLKSFLLEQEKLRKNILKDLNMEKAFAERLYHFVEWCDAFSLLICMDKIQPEGRKMEVSMSPDGVMSQTFYKGPNEITVEPWVFKTNTFKVFYEYKILEQLHFSSIAAFDKACEAAPVQREEFIFSK